MDLEFTNSGDRVFQMLTILLEKKFSCQLLLQIGLINFLLCPLVTYFHISTCCVTFDPPSPLRLARRYLRQRVSILEKWVKSIFDHLGMTLYRLHIR